MSRIPRRIAGLGASDLADAAAFDAYIGPAREITVDQQRGIIALHDGATPGGQQFIAGEDSMARDFANKWATEAEGVLVDDGINDPNYSAYHWAQVALDASTSVLPPVVADTLLGGNVAGNAWETKTPSAIIALLGGRRMISTVDYSATVLASNAYAQGIALHVKRDEIVKLMCNPTAGDDIQAMANYISAKHVVEQGKFQGTTEQGLLYLEIADGLHDINTFIDITNGRFLDMRATGAPDTYSITGVTFALISGNNYTATVTVATALPARVVPGYCVGAGDVQGNGAAAAINGGLIVKTVAGNRLSFTTDIQIPSGVTVANATSMTTNELPAIGLADSNLLFVPKCCLRVNEAGWDGAAREGFMNALSGGKIKLTYMGFSYNGIAGDNDMFFARDAGSEIAFADQCVVAGTGEMICRSFNNGHIYANRSFFGGGLTGANFVQCSGGGTAELVRCFVNSASSIGLSASTGGRIWVSLCVLVGALNIARPSYADASINITNSRLAWGLQGLVSQKGVISINSTSSIKNCSTSIVTTGSTVGGDIHGDPILSGNTADPVEGNLIDAGGGCWYKTAAPAIDPANKRIGIVTQALDFPSIAAQGFQDMVVAVPGAAFGHAVTLVRLSTWPAQAVIYEGFVSSAGNVTVRAFNITASPIDPTNASWRVIVDAKT